MTALRRNLAYASDDDFFLDKHTLEEIEGLVNKAKANKSETDKTADKLRHQAQKAEAETQNDLHQAAQAHNDHKEAEERVKKANAESVGSHCGPCEECNRCAGCGRRCR